MKLSIRGEDWGASFDEFNAIRVGRGSSGKVLAVNKELVIKVFKEDDEGMLDFERERSIYEQLNRVGGSKYIVQYIGLWRDYGLVLERQAFTLRQYLRGAMDQRLAIPYFVLDQWARDASEGLAFLHKNGIMHGDVGCHNFLVDDEGHIKICDFAGSKREGEEARVCYEVRSQHPRYRDHEPNRLTEIFALGSVIFEIICGRPPFASEPDAIVEHKYQRLEFPISCITDSRIRRIVRNCWMGQYRHVFEVCNELQC